jgi:hypothetical protein
VVSVLVVQFFTAEALRATEIAQKIPSVLADDFFNNRLREE